MFKKKESPTLLSLLLRAIFSSIAISVLISSLYSTYISYHFVLESHGTARIDILKQVSDSNDLNRKHMESIIEMVNMEVSAAVCEDDGEAIQEIITDIQSLLDRINLNYSIDVVLRDRRTFSSVSGSETRLKNLLNSYWYLKQLSGETGISWNLNVLSPDDITSYALVCSYPIADKDGRVIGTIILNSTQDALFRTYQKLLSEGERVYILDESGIVISHSNQNIVGQWLKSMDAFAKEPGYDSYVIQSYGKRKYLVSNYHDTISGWTFVEEHDITQIYNQLIQTSLVSFLMILMGGLLACLAGCQYAKKVSRSLTDMTDAVVRIDPENLHPIETSTAYHEIGILTMSFNRLICRIQDLIHDIQLREAEKHRMEYDFQQAQLSPHFLYNTLVAIKSLIHIKQYDQACQMLDKFVECLDIPHSADIQFVTIAEELHLIQNYLSIMNLRTDKAIAFENRVPVWAENILIPRMLLQPIIGNSVFHGFAEREDGCKITICASIEAETLYIRIEDNGEGIAPERLQQLAENNYASVGNHHGVGIKNIRKRLNYIYGESSSLFIQSEYGKGTVVLLKIDHYDKLPPTVQCMRDQGIHRETLDGNTLPNDTGGRDENTDRR